ncbi:MAG: hypothetical protein WC402_02350 [Candidatus Pacearchaeota archaeon]|jgi:hypothetical protein
MGKAHFERSNPRLIALAKERGYKVSVIFNLENLPGENVTSLSDCNFISVNVSGDYQKL